MNPLTTTLPMNTFTKSLLALAGLGLLAHVFISPAPNQTASPDVTPYASNPYGLPADKGEDLSERAERVRLQIALTEAEQPALDFAKMTQCVEANNCAFHVVGVASLTPSLQLSVMPDEAKTWTESDWNLAVEFAKDRGHWARANPYSAMQQYDVMPESAPYFPTAMANLEQRLNSVSVGVASGRRSNEPRKGVPGWAAKNDPARTNLAL